MPSPPPSSLGSSSSVETKQQKRKHDNVSNNRRTPVNVINSMMSQLLTASRFHERKKKCIIFRLSECNRLMTMSS